ncbi:MAG TPA: AAA family ATPase [Thermoanaerobaculia bacterium]|nr:AAA family ATPase [Thermoanaerobaculia bacterium]
MLKRIRLIDFKSFKDEEIEVAPLTLLVGANASGKSNFLDAIRFLKGVAFDLMLGEVLNGEQQSGPEAWLGIRGRAEEAVRIGANDFTIDSTWLASPVGVAEAAVSEPARVEIRHYIVCRVSPHVGLEYELVESSHLSHEVKNEGFKSLMSPSAELKSPGNRVAPALGDVIRGVQLLNMNPAEMRSYGRRGDPLGVNGRNVSGVLADLCEDPSEKEALVHWLSELCAPDIKDVEFLDIKELGDIMAFFVEADGNRISARSISDGTLRFLGTLLALQTAVPGSVILIEEIESGLHPTRIRLLVEYLETVTRERQIQVIATTHSPVVLQWLSDESLRNTVVFGRIPEHKGTIMRCLGTLPHFNEVIQRKGIDELFSTGWLEMAL